MPRRTYLLYIDILGFGALAKEIAEKLQSKEDIIRKRFLTDPLREEIAKINNKYSVQMGHGVSEIEGSDNYILAIDNLDITFQIICDLTKLPLPILGYDILPLEIGLGLKNIDDSIELDLINRTEIIEFLKMNIMVPYKNYYLYKFGKKIKNTFIVLTQDVFDDLDHYDKNYCEQIHFNNTNLYAFDILRIARRCKLFKFLNKIKNGTKLYSQIDDLYIPPIGYDEIKKALAEKRIVIITGTTECGKTYTSIRLLWEYFLEGYEPTWWSGKDEINRCEVRDKLLEIAEELTPNHIIYFEDPFGQGKYEKMEILEKQIGTIIDCIHSKENAYIIITSREEVFKEFLNEKISQSDIAEFETRLNFKRPLYNLEKRAEILTRWAESMDCVWLRNEDLKNKVIGLLSNEINLPTPLSIREFVLSTRNILDETELLKKIIEKSGSTSKRFAREIEGMSADKVLFLAFPFIGGFKVKFVEENYIKIAQNLGLNNAWSFNRVYNWFENDKISVRDGNLLFSHPSYNDAFRFLLVNSGELTSNNINIFSKVLYELSTRDESASNVASIICRYFNLLPTNIQNLIYKLFYNPYAEIGLSLGIAANYDDLPANVGEMLIDQSKRENGWIVSWAVASNFSKLPGNIQILLNELAKNDSFARPVSMAIAFNHEKIPLNLRNRLLLKFSNNNESAQFVAFALRQNFKSIPLRLRNKLLSILIDKDHATKDIFDPIVQIIALINENFELIEKPFTNAILLKLSEKQNMNNIFFSIIASRFKEIDAEIRNSILKNMALNNESLDSVLVILAHCYDYIDHDLRRDLLIKLADKTEIAERLSLVVHSNFDKIDGELREAILIELLNSDDASENLANIVQFNFDKISENIRNHLILRLIDNHKARKIIAFTIAFNFEKLPEIIQKSSFKIRNEIQDLIREYSESDKFRILSIGLIADFWPYLEVQFIKDILNNIKSVNDPKCKNTAEALLDIFSKYNIKNQQMINEQS